MTLLKPVAKSQSQGASHDVFYLKRLTIKVRDGRNCEPGMQHKRDYRISNCSPET